MAAEAEQARGHQLAGPLAALLDVVAADLHNNESIHPPHDMNVSVDDCPYCWLRAGRTLGIVGNRIAATARQPQALESPGLVIVDFLNSLPIFATRVGYRTDSTDEERKIADAAFAAHRAWLEATA